MPSNNHQHQDTQPGHIRPGDDAQDAPARYRVENGSDLHTKRSREPLVSKQSSDALERATVTTARPARRPWARHLNATVKPCTTFRVDLDTVEALVQCQS